MEKWLIQSHIHVCVCVCRHTYYLLDSYNNKIHVHLYSSQNRTFTIVSRWGYCLLDPSTTTFMRCRREAPDCGSFGGSGAVTTLSISEKLDLVGDD